MQYIRSSPLPAPERTLLEASKPTSSPCQRSRSHRRTTPTLPHRDLFALKSPSTRGAPDRHRRRLHTAWPSRGTKAPFSQQRTGSVRTPPAPSHSHCGRYTMPRRRVHPSAAPLSETPSTCAIAGPRLWTSRRPPAGNRLLSGRQNPEVPDYVSTGPCDLTESGNTDAPIFVGLTVHPTAADGTDGAAWVVLFARLLALFSPP